MKKAFSRILALALVFSSFVFTVSADEVTTWKFGGSAPVAGQDGTAQGQNGWYYMWSPETNKAGVMDVSKIKESVYSETGSSWFFYQAAGKGWIADIYAADDYTGGLTNWWLQTNDGTMNPAVPDAPYASTALGWKAPTAGTYSFTVKYTAGGDTWKDSGITYPSEGDGVTISAYAKATKLYSKATTVGMVQAVDGGGNPSGAPYAGASIDTDVTFTVSAMLKAGEMFYLIADPNADGGQDIAKAEVDVTKTGHYIDNTTAWGFGSPLYTGQDGTAQGQNGWYYMWSPETNKAGVMDASKIKESVYSETGSSWFFYLAAKKGWIADIYAADDYTGGSTNWWRQTSDGIMNPSVPDAPYASTVLGWKAPKAGTYSFIVKYTAGGQATLWEGITYPSEGDGVTISAYAKATKLYSKATTVGMVQGVDGEGNPSGDPYQGASIDTDQTFTVSAHLAIGEMAYFIVDPNTDGGQDIANLNVQVVGTEFDALPTPTAGATPTLSPNPQTNDTTPGILPILIILMASIAVLIGYAVTKKSKATHHAD